MGERYKSMLPYARFLDMGRPNVPKSFYGLPKAKFQASQKLSQKVPDL